MLNKSFSLRYTHILQMIAVVLITFGLCGKVFNCIIFLRKPVSRERDISIDYLNESFSFVEHRQVYFYY